MDKVLGHMALSFRRSRARRVDSQQWISSMKKEALILMLIV
jgi:hypothetical protein